MPKNIGLDISDIEKDIEIFLRKAGNLVAQDLVREIAQREQPDGSPQKANSPSTVLAKGHDHPLVDKQILCKRATYPVRYDKGKKRVRITVRPVRRKIVGYTEDKGYHFFGISKTAVKKIDRLLDGWLHRLCSKMVK